MAQNTTMVLHTYNNLMEATIALGKLKTASIDCFLEDQNAMGLNPLGGVELKVFTNDKEKAEKIIKA